MTKVVYNACFGGFSLSKKGAARYAELKGMSVYDSDIPRADPMLVQVVEELGDEANGDYAELRIKDVPPGTLYRIDEYDGNESVMTQSEYDWSVA